MNFLLIHPPVVKLCEPPAGLARLKGAMQANGVRCCILDANMEGLLDLIAGASGNDAWTRRAIKNRALDASLLRRGETYTHLSRYRRSVSDLNRLAAVAASASGVRLTLTDYQDENLSAVHSRDLLLAAKKPASNPFYPYFSRRLSDLMTQETF